MNYTISEMAKLLGVTPHTLRYYEKVGIIQPWTDEENGYRYYSVVDTRRFNLCRSLRAAGFSLEDCRTLVEQPGAEAGAALLEGQIKVLRRQALLTDMAIEWLEELQRDCMNLEQRVGRMTIAHKPDCWRLPFSNNERPIPDAALDREKQKWQECLPAVRWVSRIPHDTLAHFGQGPVKYDYGFMIHESNARALGLRMTPHVEFVAGGDYLATVWKQTGRGPFDWDSLRAPLQYMRERGIRAYGDAFSYILASRVNEAGEAENYHFLGIRLFS